MAASLEFGRGLWLKLSRSGKIRVRVGAVGWTYCRTLGLERGQRWDLVPNHYRALRNYYYYIVPVWLCKLKQFNHYCMLGDIYWSTHKNLPGDGAPCSVIILFSLQKVHQKLCIYLTWRKCWCRGLSRLRPWLSATSPSEPLSLDVENTHTQSEVTTNWKRERWCIGQETVPSEWLRNNRTRRTGDRDRFQEQCSWPFFFKSF